MLLKDCDNLTSACLYQRFTNSYTKSVVTILKVRNGSTAERFVFLKSSPFNERYNLIKL